MPRDAQGKALSAPLNLPHVFAIRSLSLPGGEGGIPQGDPGSRRKPLSGVAKA
jgi:hypothetical protein